VAALGVHYILARTVGSSTAVPAIFDIVQAIGLSPTGGIVGSTVTAGVTGFAAGETVAFRFYKTGTNYTTLTTAVASAIGSASANLVIPSSTYGGHKIEALGQSSGKKVSATYSVAPSLVLIGSSGPAGTSVKPSGRGFGPRESVALSIETSPGHSTPLIAILSAATGSISAVDANVFIIPNGLAPGVYPITARGTTSGATVKANFTVTDVEGAATEEASPTATPVPTETPLPTATPEESTATSEPTATPEPPDDPAPVITSVEVIETGDTYVRLRIKTTGADAVQVEYGPDTGYGASLAEPVRRERAGASARSDTADDLPLPGDGERSRR
jgi:hypothetical protein